MSLVNNPNIIGNLNGGDTVTSPGTATSVPGDEMFNGTAVSGSSMYGDDMVGSGSGFESYQALAGDDTISGGAGFDQLDYSADAANRDANGLYGTSGVNVNLATGTAIDGFGDTDSFTGMTNVLGTAQGDVMTGGGNDFFESFNGGAGNDIIDGASGFDQVSYRGNAGVNVNLATGVATDEFGDTDTLSNIEYVNATDQADFLTGGNAASDDFEAFAGRGGDDMIDGGSGCDQSVYVLDHYSGGNNGINANLTGGGAGTVTDGYGDTDTLAGIEGIYGSVFNDVINGSADDEMLNGAAGDDIINGGDGYDMTSYLMDEVHESSVSGDYGTSGVIVDLANHTATDAYGDTDTLTGIEAVEGTRSDDRFTGDAEDNAFYGHAGNDMFDGMSGNDTVSYARDVDSAAIGEVTAVDTPVLGGVNVDLAAGTATDSFGDIDTLSNIENIEGTGLGDVITGDAGNNMLMGMDGVDMLNGGMGDDLLDGGMGNDMLAGGMGSDTLMGGAGIDTASYADSTSGITLRLYNGTGVGGFADGDTLQSVENAIGTDFADSIIGSYGVDNVLEGGAGADYLNGLTGNNTASYAGSASSVTVRLYNDSGAGGDAQGDTLANIANATGSANGDTLVGAFGESNHLSGGQGNDYLFGLSGDDILDGGMDNDLLAGGSGADMLNGGAGIDTASYASSSGGVIVRLYNGTGASADAAGDTYESIENVIGSDNADALIGAYGADNVLQGGAGADYINGLGGSNTASYAGSDEGVTVRLYNGTGARGDAAGDTLVNIDNVIGSASNDLLLGSYGTDNVINGGAGGDHLFGLTGTDRFVFDDNFGNDVIHDFENGTELMDMSGSSFSADDLRIETVGSDTVVHFDQLDADVTDTITLSGITSDIDSSDFIF